MGSSTGILVLGPIWSSLRKQQTFGNAAAGFLAKWHLRNKSRNSLLMTHYPDLGTASYWLCRVGNLIQPIRSTTQIWEVTRHQYGISALVSQMGNQYMVVLPNVSCFLRLPNECRTQWLTRIDFQISFNPDGQIDDGFLKGQSWNEITMTPNIYSGSWIYIGYNIPLSHTDQETVTRVCHDFDSLTQ